MIAIGRAVKGIYYLINEPMKDVIEQVYENVMSMTDTDKKRA